MSRAWLGAGVKLFARFLNGPRWLLLVAALAVFSPIAVKALSPLQATVAVTATDPNGYPLTYHWKSTDGTIVDQNSPTTTWTLPDGPGVHLAYVMITNGHGGYTERRVPVITDAIGTPVVAPPAVNIDAPASPAPVGESYRSRLNAVSSLGDISRPDLTDIPVALRDLATGQMYPAQTCGSPPCTVKTDLKGEFTLHNVLPGNLQVLCAFDRGASLASCNSNTVLPGKAYVDYFTGSGPFLMGNDIVGSAVGSDGRPCGIISRFFSNVAGGGSLGEVSASASLFDSNGVLLQGPVRLDAYGAYQFLPNTKAANIRITCEGATPLTVLVPATVATGGGFVAASTLANVAHPVVSNMKATLANGTVFNGPLLPAGSGTLPSDQQFVPNRFFSFLGMDTKKGACQYYRAIGGVQGCDANGNFIGPISYDDWKRSEKMSPYLGAGAVEHTANFVNKVDLNLARRHHLVTYGTNQTAGVVCNHLGPKVSKVGLDALQPDVDDAITAALAGNNLVACVAMDYRVHPGVNGDQPFTRYFIFGPNGQLLPSINLDFEDEKYVPGVCAGCHGGDHYVGPYPEDGSGRADFGGHFLPYDSANFSFSTSAALTESAQEAEIYVMNQIIASSTGATNSAKELIAGWYAHGAPVMDKSWVPLGWKDRTNNIAYYQNVYSRHCRTCHVNMPHDFPVAKSVTHFAQVMCGGYRGHWRNHTMPNSMVTFNRFWLGAGAGVGSVLAPDQITPTEKWGSDGTQFATGTNCYLTTTP